MVSMLNEDDVTHIGAAFDTTVESFRNALFDGYKTGEGLDPELFAQFPLAERVSRALGMATWSMIEFEADDGLASAAYKFRDAPGVEQVVICSPDKDLCQCVIGDKVVSFDRRQRIMLNADGVRAKFGVDPESIPDYLALVGDAADGIPGIPRWGKKGASTVLAKFKHIGDIPEDPESWDLKVRGAKNLAENLNSRREEAALYKKLATLRTDAPIPESLDEIKWQGVDRPALEALCEELGESSVLDRI